jgi:monoamine oxidase
MANAIGDQLLLNTAVNSIRWSKDRVVVESGERVFIARNVIIAVPQTLIEEIAFTPNLPPLKATLHKRSVMGSAIKFWVQYERPFWRDQGLNGMIFQDDSPVTPIVDVTPPNQRTGVLVGFFDSDAALTHADLSTEARCTVVLETLTEHFGPMAKHPLAYLDHDWTSARWSKGCYGAFTPPGILAGYGEWLRDPIGPLHWAGTETSPIWTGYIEGAIRSGERAAAEVATSNQYFTPPCAVLDGSPQQPRM